MNIVHLVQSGFSSVGPFVLLLGFLVFVHELGHFMVAKWCGVRVQVFSLGFGKKILQFKLGDTTYCLSLIPLGGYVKMFGDEVGAQIPADEQRYSFTHKKLWQRFAVVVAGPLMNFFFAILIFTLTASLGEEVRKPVIGDVSEDSPAFALGFRSGDEILRVNNQEVQTWEDFQTNLNQSIQNKIILDVQSLNSNQPQHIEVTPVAKANENLLSLSSTVGDIPGLSNLSRAPVVGVLSHSKAEKIGLQTGDRILSVNAQPVTYFRELENLVLTLQGRHLSMEVERGLEKDIKKVVLEVEKVPAVPSLLAFGIEIPDLYLAKIVPDSPAAQAGLAPGDRIISITSTDPTVNQASTLQPKKWDDVLNTVKKFSGQGRLHFQILRSGKSIPLDIAPQMTSHMTMQGAEEKRFTIGIIPWVQSAAPSTKVVVANGISQAFQRGYHRTWEVTTMTVMSFWRLLQNKISSKNIGGVISIGQAASETFKNGMVQFLHLMAIISVNLFILNLLPIPVLDGGHLLFYVIEAVRGSPVSMRKMEIAQQFGLVVLMSLMALSLFNDFSRVLGFW